MIEGSTQETIVLSAPPNSAEPAKLPSKTFFLVSAVLIAAFGKVLLDLVSYSLKVDLHSHALLVPFISGYLIWQDRDKIPSITREFSIAVAILSLLGFACLGVYFGLRAKGHVFLPTDYLALTSLAFIAFFSAAVVYFFGRRFARVFAFPLFFLVFLVPLPHAAQDRIEIWAQLASADAYAMMMDATFQTYLRDGQSFHMPGLSLVVAQECSGVRSSFVLFITSLLAGYMFLRSPWRRTALSLLVFPLAIARNAFRIWTLSILTIHWHPDVIHSPLHHRGGPIFFALSLIPFFGILYLLRRGEMKRSVQPTLPNIK